MNEEMVRKYAPMLTAGNTPIGNPGDTGTGIMMGMSVGAAAINVNISFDPGLGGTECQGGIETGDRFVRISSQHPGVACLIVQGRTSVNVAGLFS